LRPEFSGFRYSLGRWVDHVVMYLDTGGGCHYTSAQVVWLTELVHAMM
jgi:hypothetical protein